MSSTRLALTLAVTAAVALTASASEACPVGVSGIADPGSTVCAQSTSGALYCDVADAGGNFYITGGVVPPSTSFGCLPVSGTFFFYEIGCEPNGMNVDRDDPGQEYGGDWLDLRCDPAGGEGGQCDHGIYSEASVSYPPSSPESILMCQCNLLDPACGLGTCMGGAYMTGTACPFPVGYSPSSVVSQVMCGGATIDPDTCEIPCEPYSTDSSAGVCDGFSSANGPEPASPSAGLSAYVASVYPVSTTRDFDEIHANEWFAHTFTGLAPNNGMRICGARLSGTIGKGKGSLADNDSLGLMFVDGTGAEVAPGYSASLASYGISGGGAASITIDIGSLPGGVAMLTQMESGWLDFIVQDDTAVDCLDLHVDYCCPCEPYGASDSAGTCDGFAPGSEPTSPSAGLLTYISSVYPVPGSRNFDDILVNQWLGHTFDNLEPQNGTHICAAKLTATIGKGKGSLTDNDSLGLLFIDGSGTPVAPGYGAALSSFGISGGSSATVTLDIGSLPGGAAMLTQMESGWLDFIVQDDTAVDCIGLKISYCCDADSSCAGGGDTDVPPSTK